jgi:hypothetical protein
MRPTSLCLGLCEYCLVRSMSLLTLSDYKLTAVLCMVSNSWSNREPVNLHVFTSNRKCILIPNPTHHLCIHLLFSICSHCRISSRQYSLRSHCFICLTHMLRTSYLLYLNTVDRKWVDRRSWTEWHKKILKCNLLSVSVWMKFLIIIVLCITTK